ncbi:hypothetical protein D918_07369 [Trichuris suis]|nr:hypothetical protein D918_07369 [Trichuris suis]
MAEAVGVTERLERACLTRHVDASCGDGIVRVSV